MAGVEDTYYEYLQRQYRLATKMELNEENVLIVLEELIPYIEACLLYTSPSPRDVEESRMPSSA